jgi:uncharacterized protein DUF2809
MNFAPERLYERIRTGRSWNDASKSIGTARSRLWLAVGLVAVIALGLASRRFPSLSPASLGKYPGDAFWALMVFLGWGFLKPRASTRHLATFALVIACLIELSQLYHTPWLDSVRGTTLGRLVLGSVFSWFDIAAYAVGVVLGVIVDKLILDPSGLAVGKRMASPSTERSSTAG